jgi:N-acetylneuraminic acid mutarotase
VGVYQFQLKVTDAGGLFSNDTVKVTLNAAPVAMTCGVSNRPIINARLTPIARLSEPSSGMAVATAGNKILFAGASLSGSPPNYGSSTVHIFDFSTQTWSTAALSTWRADVAAVAAGNKIFFAGGRLGNGGSYNYFSTVDIYDVTNNNWSVANLSQPRAYIAAAAVGDKVLFAGGEQEWPRPVSDRVDIYQLSTNSWSTASLSVQRNGLTAVTANNTILFAGGSNQLSGSNNVTNIIDVYDNATNSWSTSTLAEPKAFFAGNNVGGKIYWAGGYGGNGSPTCKVEIRDPVTQTSSAAFLFHPFSYVTHEGMNVVVKDNKIIWFATLDPSNGNATDKFNIYDMLTNTWSIGLLPVKMNAASVIAVNNTIYVAGGYINGQMSDQVWKLEF